METCTKQVYHTVRGEDASAVINRRLHKILDTLGFNTHKENEDGMPIEWLDVCVCESLLGGPTLKCDWLDVDSDTQTASLKGHAHERPIDRDAFKFKKPA